MYAYADNTYVCGKFDPVTKETTVLYDMMERYGWKYISGFLMEDGYFIYSEMDTPSVVVVRVEDGTEVLRHDARLVLSGADLMYRKGTVIYRSYNVTGEQNPLYTVYLPDIQEE